MFTGIIQGLGRIVQVTRNGNERRFSIKPLFAMENLKDGESIAVNGVCLSVEKHFQEDFLVYASRETIEKSNLGDLQYGDTPNLERALEVGERLGGHIISGHVDCVATVRSLKKSGESLGLTIIFPPEFAPQIVSKGSVALNGISLTINTCGQNYLEVNIIPDSQKRTNITSWGVGAKINMETDIIGKYVERMLSPWKTTRVTSEYLEKYGFA